MELGQHYEYTLKLLAGRLVTPERFGAVALSELDTPLEFPDEVSVC